MNSIETIGILGGGVSGLTLALQLKDHYDIDVFEKEDTPGGLCRSFGTNGFIYDIGGHIMFSRDQKVLNFMIDLVGREKLFEKPGNDRIFYDKDHLVKYPFETDLYALPKEISFECLYHFINNPNKKDNPDNFKEWVYSTFGKGIAENYLIPYNRKVWKLEPEEMNISWVEKIPQPHLEDLLKSALGIRPKDKYERKTFYYPKKGGYFTVIQSLMEQVSEKVKLSEGIMDIRKEGGKWHITTTKSEYEYDEIITTLPVHDFFNLLSADVPKEVEDALRGLRYTSIATVLLGVKGRQGHEYTAMYFKQPDFYPHRVCFMNGFSENCSPAGHFSCLAEITFNPGGEFSQYSDEKIINNMIYGLDERDIIRKNQVVYTHISRHKYAYAVYTKDYQKNREIVYTWLVLQGVKSSGRFAEFMYLNSDLCIKHALDLSDLFIDQS